MDEDRAATPGDTWPGVVVDLDNEVVQIVLARQPISFGIRRHFYAPIIMAVGWILAPAVVGHDALRRQHRGRARMPSGPPPQPLEPECAARRRAVALAFIGFDAATPERDRQGQRPRRQPAAAWVAWFSLDDKARERVFSHGLHIFENRRFDAKYQFALALLA